MEKLQNKITSWVGVVLGTFVLWAPAVGIDFNQADADGIAAYVNELITAAGVAVAGIGSSITDFKEKL